MGPRVAAGGGLVHGDALGAQLADVRVAELRDEELGGVVAERGRERGQPTELLDALGATPGARDLPGEERPHRALDHGRGFRQVVGQAASRQVEEAGEGDSRDRSGTQVVVEQRGSCTGASSSTRRGGPPRMPRSSVGSGSRTPRRRAADRFVEQRAGARRIVVGQRLREGEEVVRDDIRRAGVPSQLQPIGGVPLAGSGVLPGERAGRQPEVERGHRRQIGGSRTCRRLDVVVGHLLERGHGRGGRSTGAPPTMPCRGATRCRARRRSAAIRTPRSQSSTARSRSSRTAAAFAVSTSATAEPGWSCASGSASIASGSKTTTSSTWSRWRGSLHSRVNARSTSCASRRTPSPRTGCRVRPRGTRQRTTRSVPDRSCDLGRLRQLGVVVTVTRRAARRCLLWPRDAPRRTADRLQQSVSRVGAGVVGLDEVTGDEVRQEPRTRRRCRSACPSTRLRRPRASRLTSQWPCGTEEGELTSAARGVANTLFLKLGDVYFPARLRCVALFSGRSGLPRTRVINPRPAETPALLHKRRHSCETRPRGLLFINSATYFGQKWWDIDLDPSLIFSMRGIRHSDYELDH